VGDAREIPFGLTQGRLSLRLKNGCARDDAAWVVTSKVKINVRTKIKGNGQGCPFHTSHAVG
jgi:hypothetical protein